MPRPTAAQLSYGSVTVVFSTLAMLLLSRTESGIGIAVIGTAALALGLLVAVTVPLAGAQEHSESGEDRGRGVRTPWHRPRRCRTRGPHPRPRTGQDPVRTRRVGAGGRALAEALTATAGRVPTPSRPSVSW